MVPYTRQVDERILEFLFDLFQGKASRPVGEEDEEELWLDEVAARIARAGARGVDFLLSCAEEGGADEARVRAVLVALRLAGRRLSARNRSRLCELARTLLGDGRPLVVQDAVDTLSELACPGVDEAIRALGDHPSPYVVGSVLRYLALHHPGEAVPVLQRALESDEAVIRMNAVDELDEMNYKPALPLVRRLLKDPDPGVRQAAATAVAHLADDT